MPGTGPTPIDEPLIATSEADLISAVRAADEAGIPLRIVGDGPARPGSRLVRVATTGLSVNEDGCDVDDLAYCGGVLVTIAAGQRFEDLVSLAVDRQWVGIEALAGLGGRVGGAVMHNVANYGQAVADTLASVRTFDRVARRQRTFALVECEFGEHTSPFTRSRLDAGTPRYLIAEASFLMRQGTLSAPIRNPVLAEAVGVPAGGRVPLPAVREAVLALMSRTLGGGGQ